MLIETMSFFGFWETESVAFLRAATAGSEADLDKTLTSCVMRRYFVTFETIATDAHFDLVVLVGIDQFKKRIQVRSVRFVCSDCSDFLLPRRARKVQRPFFQNFGAPKRAIPAF